MTSADLTVPPQMPHPAGFIDADGDAHVYRHGDVYTAEQIDAINAIWSERIASLQARLEAAERDAALWRQWAPYLSRVQRKPYGLARAVMQWMADNAATQDGKG